MPRDLEAENAQAQASSPPVTLTESPNSVATERSDCPDEEESPTRQRQFVIIPQDLQNKATTNLHPYTRPLTISDLESVVALENSAFSNPEELATREKVRRFYLNPILKGTRDLMPD